jgi:hypothetical protein
MASRRAYPPVQGPDAGTNEKGEAYTTRLRRNWRSDALITRPCGACGDPVPQRTEGRPREYCSPRCRVSAYRAAQRAEREALLAATAAPVTKPLEHGTLTTETVGADGTRAAWTWVPGRGWVDSDDL